MANEKANQPFHAGTGCQYHGSVLFGEGSILGNYVVVGYPKEERLANFQGNGNFDALDISLLVGEIKQTEIGSRCRVASRVTIYEGSKIGNEISIDDNCRLGYDCCIGDNSSLLYSAFICDRVQIGRNSIVSGFVGDGTRIGNYVTSMGKLIHEFSCPEGDWGVIEPSPIIEDRVVIGFDAIIIGGITIGHNSYITAGATVTKDVPPKSIVIGCNKIIPSSEWKGKKLSKEFWTWEERNEM